MTAISLPRIEVIGKPNCPNCDDMKEYLQDNKLPFTEHSMDYHGNYHPEWRNDGSVEILAAYQFIQELPMVSIDGEIHSDEDAMAILESVIHANIAS